MKTMDCPKRGTVVLLINISEIKMVFIILKSKKRGRTTESLVGRVCAEILTAVIEFL